MLRRPILLALLATFLAGSLAACGKRPAELERPSGKEAPQGRTYPKPQ